MKRMGALVVLALLMQLLYVNCGPGFKSKFSIDEETQAALGNSVFHSVLVDAPELEDLATSETTITEIRREIIGASIPTVGGPQAPPVPSPTPTPPPACTEKPASLNALVESIKSVADASHQSVTHGELKGCEAGLVKFSAAAYDAEGNLVKGIQVNDYRTARVGVYCPFPKGGGIDLLVRFFKGRGIRGGKIKTTHLCKHGTDPKKCNPSHANYIGGFGYGVYGDRHRVSNVNGTGNGQNTELDAQEIVEKIYLPKDVVYSDLGKCNGVALWSPLVIEHILGRGIETEDPRNHQTFFDLTGTGVQHRISCVKGGSFLTLPDENGEIKNINQLFGDNTLGPDGNKSKNGFEALSKHDKKVGHPDYGIITTDDAVYSRLRLWEDRDCSGTAESDELSSLESNSIAGIQWIDHIEMMHVDAYGNQTLQRNVAFLTEKRSLRVFDLWFFANYGFRAAP